MITVEIATSASGTSQPIQTASEIVTAWLIGFDFYADETITTPVTPTTGTVTIEYNNGTGIWRQFQNGLVNIPFGLMNPVRATGNRILFIRATFDGVDAPYARLKFLCDTDVDASLSSSALTDNNRVRVQTLDIQQQYTLDGIGYDWWWRIRAAAAPSRSFAKFTVPDGFYMALANRIYQSNAAESYYRVYRPDVINQVGEVIGADLPLKSNLRADSGINFANVANVVTLQTLPNIDDAFIEIPIFSIQGQASTNLGEFNAENAFRLLPPGGVFYLELNNATTGGGASAYLKIRLVLGFIPIALVPPDKV